jgi:hypothetical protein
MFQVTLTFIGKHHRNYHCHNTRKTLLQLFPLFVFSTEINAPSRSCKSTLMYDKHAH